MPEETPAAVEDSPVPFVGHTVVVEDGKTVLPDPQPKEPQVDKDGWYGKGIVEIEKERLENSTSYGVVEPTGPSIMIPDWGSPIAPGSQAEASSFSGLEVPVGTVGDPPAPGTVFSRSDGTPLFIVDKDGKHWDLEPPKASPSTSVDPTPQTAEQLWEEIKADVIAFLLGRFGAQGGIEHAKALEEIKVALHREGVEARSKFTPGVIA